MSRSPQCVTSVGASLARGVSPAVLCWQSLREEKQNYERELAQARAKYEEEAAHVKEGQAQVLEELMEKHRAQLESARTATEREKNQLLNASAFIHTQLRSVWGPAFSSRFDSQPTLIQ